MVDFSNYTRSIITLHIQGLPIPFSGFLPLWELFKKLLFSFTTTHPGLFHWWKQAKPTLCVCLLEKIASFIYRPLALFSQWIPGLNAISQETLPMCSPVIPHCLQAESSTEDEEKKRGGGNLNVASQAIKIHTLVCYVLRNHRCVSIRFKPAGNKREKKV